MKKRVFAMIVAAAVFLPPSLRAEEAAAFDFESKSFPVKALFDLPLEIGERDGVQLGREERLGKESGVLVLSGDRKAAVALPLRAGNPLAGELGALTVSLLFKADEAVSTPVYLQRIDGTSSRPGYFSFHNQNNQERDGGRKGTFRLTITSEAGAKTVASTEPWTLSQKEWRAVAMVFDQGVVRFYLDGQLHGKPVEVPMPVIPAMMQGKGSLRSGLGFHGAIDDLVVLPNRALDAGQIRQLHEEGLASEAVRALLKR